MKLDKEKIRTMLTHGLPGAKVEFEQKSTEEIEAINVADVGQREKEVCLFDLMPYARARLAILSSSPESPEEIYIDKLDVFDDVHGETFQKQGIGKKILSNLAKIVQELHIDRLTLRGADIGSYMWLRAGFLPDRVDTESVKRSLVDRIDELDAPTDEKKALKAILDSRGPKCLWNIVDSKYGFQLLRGIQYDAELYSLE